MSDPDGHTIFMATNSTLVTNRYLFKELPYDPDAFEHIGMIGTSPMVLLSTKQDNFKSVANLPTMAESGFPGFEMTAWFTLVAPPDTLSSTSPAKLTRALDTALRDEPMRQHMLLMGIEPSEGTPRALTRQIEKALPIIQSLIELADIAVQ